MVAEDYVISYFKNKTVLIFIPHQDDEVCLAGALIAMLRKKGITIYIAYSTNGDYRFPARVRIREARKALHCLGVDTDHIIFLGYGDTPNNEKSHIMYAAENAAVVSYARKSSTYGCKMQMDYATAKYGQPHEYTKSNILKDIKNVILDITPEIIIASDFDYHSDHRALSILLEEAVGEIICEYNKYRPIIYKGFTYATAFYARADYTGYNLKSTIRNGFYENEKFTLDNPTYRWEERIRFPVPKYARTKWIHNNIIFKAMKQHVSQYGVHFANNISNSDQVFWIRKTNSLTYLSNIQIRASSGETKCLNDFKRLDSDEILKGEGERISFTKGLWKADIFDKEKFFSVKFKEGKRINKISFYENPDESNNIINALILMDNGFQIKVNNIMHDGTKTNLEFPIQEEIHSVTFKILEMEGEECGISEFEIYEPEVLELWFIKICIGDTYVYSYCTDDKIVEFDIKAYSTTGDPVKFDNLESIMTLIQNGTEKQLQNKRFFFDTKKANLSVKAYLNGKMVSDEIEIKRKNKLQRKLVKKGNEISEFFYTMIARVVNKLYRIRYTMRK